MDPEDDPLIVDDLLQDSHFSEMEEVYRGWFSVPSTMLLSKSLLLG